MTVCAPEWLAGLALLAAAAGGEGVRGLWRARNGRSRDSKSERDP